MKLSIFVQTEKGVGIIPLGLPEQDAIYELLKLIFGGDEIPAIELDKEFKFGVDNVDNVDNVEEN